MKRTLKLLAVSGVALGSITGIAAAASSPTVVTGAPTSVNATRAVLHGRVNPNGLATQYVFSYGPTVAYGVNTVVHAVGHGAKGVDVARAVTGLTPGTVYHYRISAVNRAGTGVGADRTFTTTGHPPAAVVTGGPINVGKTSATITGSINPNGATTSYQIQYGPTTAYGYATFAVPLAALTTPVPVSVPLGGLAPRTLFHYRVVAFHGSTSSAGADATFFTEPWSRPKPQLTAHTTPSRDKRSPYTFTTSGGLRGGGFIPAPQRCTGNVGVRYYNGRHQLAFVVAPVSSDCRFSVPATFRRLHGRGPARLRVNVDFRGNGYLQPGIATDHVTAG